MHNEKLNMERIGVRHASSCLTPVWPPAWLTQAQTLPVTSEIPNNPVCPHTEIQEFRTFDGYLNRQCKACGEWFTCRKAEETEAECP